MPGIFGNLAFEVEKLILLEDEDLLVANKPPGVNTHQPSPYANEGLYEWLRHREAARSNLAIIHRLDKETSGPIVFAKSPQANRSLTAQFAGREVRKEYQFLTDREVSWTRHDVTSAIVRSGERYLSRPMSPGGTEARTSFEFLGNQGSFKLWKAVPWTGRTHQIRVHAAALGIPIVGDTLYGGRPADRVCLHAERMEFRHPVTEAPLRFVVPPDFEREMRAARRGSFIDPQETNAFRWLHGAADGQAGWHVDRFGDYLLSESEQALSPDRLAFLAGWVDQHGLKGAYHKRLLREVGKAPGQTSPQPVVGEGAPERFDVLENGVRFEISFEEGYSVGLFLDQRENRRRLLTGHVGAGFELPGKGGKPTRVLNAFAYCCGFSVCAGLAGGEVTSLDLSKKYLEWGRRNFTANGLDPARHDFIYGDVFDWLGRLARKGRQFEVILLDPPTFSQSKEFGHFRAAKDYGRLVGEALPLLATGGVLFCSTNAATLSPEDFLADVRGAVSRAGRRVEQEHYAAQPLDFPISREEPGYLKTVWMRVG